MDGAADKLALLSLLIAWGADEALAEEPVNRLMDSRPVTVMARTEPALPPTIGPGMIPPSATISADTLEALRKAILEFSGCSLRDTATNSVTAEGDPGQGLLIIGEAPGAEDDRGGRPFLGPAGAVLDRLLTASGMAREKVLLAPLIPWRPPGNRPPTDAELAQCMPFLHRLIVIARPRHILLTGILPARALLGGDASPRRNRGKWQKLMFPGLEEPIPTLCSFGLAGLKTGAERQSVWADWRMLHRNIHLIS